MSLLLDTNLFSMPRKLIKRYIPNPETVKENKFLSVFGKVIHDPQLWHLTRYSVSRAFMVGMFCAFIPVPFQMLIAAGGAIIFRANLAVSVALVWITNPVTMPFLFGLAYFVGVWTLGLDPTANQFEISWDWIFTNGGPFLWGCFICGVIAAALSYVGIRLFWRLHIISTWKARNQKRHANKNKN